MIELHVPADRTATDRAIEAKLHDLVVAHSVRVHDRPGHDLPPVDLPAVYESGAWVGRDELDRWMADLRVTLRQWRKFQSDACYIDDDGSVC